MAAKLEELPKEARSSVTSVCARIRDAIATALSIAPEEFLTILVLGIVIDVTDSDEGGPFVYDDFKHAFPPTSVRQSEASLVDGMMPIASIVVGNERKSVSRSYSLAIDALIPVSPTFNPSDGIPSHGKMDYAKSMAFLKQQVPGTTKTVHEVYRDKEMNWVKQQQILGQAKIQAVQDAEDAFREGTEDFLEKRQKHFEDWINAKDKGKAYRSAVQAAWMDWVVNGKKYEVEYAFSAGQMDSMARIELSKESMRNSAIDEASGDGEVYGVSLSPRKWAAYCKQKANGDVNTDKWSEIMLSYPASDLQTHESGPVGIGLWSLGGVEGQKEALEAMAACNVNISFSALVVEISRPWLHSELFSDRDLQLPRGEKLSPGPSRLHEMMKNKQVDEWSFPAFPTSFIIAADTTIVFTGETKAIEQFLKSDGATVGYGPWSASGVDVSEKLKVESTAAGCKINFGAPQIIGWQSASTPPLLNFQSRENETMREATQATTTTNQSSYAYLHAKLHDAVRRISYCLEKSTSSQQAQELFNHLLRLMATHTEHMKSILAAAILRYNVETDIHRHALREQIRLRRGSWAKYFEKVSSDAQWLQEQWGGDDWLPDDIRASCETFIGNPKRPQSTSTGWSQSPRQLRLKESSFGLFGPTAALSGSPLLESLANGSSQDHDANAQPSSTSKKRTFDEMNDSETSSYNKYATLISDIETGKMERLRLEAIKNLEKAEFDKAASGRALERCRARRDQIRQIRQQSKELTDKVRNALKEQGSHVLAGVLAETGAAYSNSINQILDDILKTPSSSLVEVQRLKEQHYTAIVALDRAKKRVRTLEKIQKAQLMRKNYVKIKEYRRNVLAHLNHTDERAGAMEEQCIAAFSGAEEED
ncbi:hypothetical protein FBEOM_10698 [Fusarium beomiforme]|uniref:Uncharacterized protein n=1 Tax=Fusarium beomiforme TaxID=44412 RepID=A0A9P5ABE5_9HYPO|nr:hypothetical protein FBEOM_10698 [Fusarium beomiforme]